MVLLPTNWSRLFVIRTEISFSHFTFSPPPVPLPFTKTKEDGKDEDMKDMAEGASETKDTLLETSTAVVGV